MNIKGVAIRVMVGLVIALSLPIVAQNWETGAMKAEREAQEEAKRKQEEETARKDAAVRASISTVTDPRDGQKYRTLKIGGKTWMAENLNYAIDGSGCYNNDAANCKKYGRLYLWDAAKDACLGIGGKWRLPTRGDWDNLANFAGGKKVAGKKLKAKSGWSENGNGTDDYGFSAMPGGNRFYGDGSFLNAGNFGAWWSSTEGGGGKAYYVGMGCSHDNVGEDTYGVRDGFSVRCVADGSETSAQPSTPQTRSTSELKVSGSSDLSLTGGRSRDSIQRVVMQNMAVIRYAYHRRLRDKPGLNGKITVKFAINEFGKVIFAQVVESTMADPELERTMVDRVKSWIFDKIDKPGDVTEVTYPFVFSQ